jgi:hypothetical protein
MSAKEKLTELQLRVRQLLDQVEQMYVLNMTHFNKSIPVPLHRRRY